MKFTITVRQALPSDLDAQNIPPAARPEIVYEQTVPELNLAKLIAAVNAKPRKPRVTKPKSV